VCNLSDEQLEGFRRYSIPLVLAKGNTEAAIEEFIKEDQGIAMLDESCRQRLERLLKATMLLTQERGEIIRDGYKPWLAARQSEEGGIDSYYWPRLQKYLIETGELPPAIVSTLDHVTDDILDSCGDPKKDGSWSYRGMVIGHVQSGKTTNYGSLICKAADAGYKVIILLAGITNSLRSQTQQRMDEYFIGRKTVFNAATEVSYPITNYSLNGKPRTPDFGTSEDSDFDRNNAVAGAAFAALAEPKIFVCKKNKSILGNLNTWIKDQAVGQRINQPLLLIDDEADNASINTHQDPTRSTAINCLIKEILSQFERSTYIGYTATPFANIFIDPDSEDELKREDLFPRNFIKALEPPTNYCGAERYFSDEGNLRKVSVRNLNDDRFNSDYKDILPLPHKKDVSLEVIPPSLEFSVRCFILGITVRILRGQGSKHCTMMVNVSRFNDIQDKVHGEIYKYITQLKNAITVFSKSADPFRDHNILDLKNTFEEEFAETIVDDEIIDFDSVLPLLNEAISPVLILTVNMKSKKGTLNYKDKAHKDTGLRVIAIGGLALSRGLTLEGLMTTYLLRNVSASDTLMQMARWFGYRNGFEDLCRIFLPEEGIEHYESIHAASEELREEIDRMSFIEETPINFGLKVRQSETGIRITAANKMRAAKAIKLAAGYSGRYVQVHAIHNSQDVNAQNLSIGSDFVNSLGVADSEPPGGDKTPPYYWSHVNGTAIHELLEQLEYPNEILPLAKLEGKRSLLGDYISDPDRLSQELSAWDVCIASRRTSVKGVDPVDSFYSRGPINVVRRTAALIDETKPIYRFSGAKNNVGDQDTVKIGLSANQAETARNLNRIAPMNKYCCARERPLFVIFLIHPEESLSGLKLEGPLFSIAMCLPETDVPVVERVYQINQVMQRQMQRESENNSDDDQSNKGEDS